MKEKVIILKGIDLNQKEMKEIRHSIIDLKSKGILDNYSFLITNMKLEEMNLKQFLDSLKEIEEKLSKVR